MTDLSIVEYLIKIGPYVGIYFFVETIKRAFKIKGEWVWLTAFILGWAMAAAQIIILEVKLAPIVFVAKIFFNGVVLGAISIGFRKIWTEKFKNHKPSKESK